MEEDPFHSEVWKQQALRSHAKGKKHMDKFAFMKKVKTESTLSAFVRVEQPSSTHGAEQTGVSSAVSPEITVDDLNIPDPHLPHAEASSSQTL